MAGNVIRAEKIKYGRSNSSALCYSASEIALYAILRVVQATKCDFGAFCVHCGYFVTTVTVKPKAELLRL